MLNKEVLNVAEIITFTLIVYVKNVADCSNINVIFLLLLGSAIGSTKVSSTILIIAKLCSRSRSHEIFILTLNLPERSNWPFSRFLHKFNHI